MEVSVGSEVKSVSGSRAKLLVEVTELWPLLPDAMRKWTGVPGCDSVVADVI